MQEERQKGWEGERQRVRDTLKPKRELYSPSQTHPIKDLSRRPHCLSSPGEENNGKRDTMPSSPVFPWIYTAAEQWSILTRNLKVHTGLYLCCKSCLIPLALGGGGNSISPHTASSLVFSSLPFPLLMWSHPAFHSLDWSHTRKPSSPPHETHQVPLHRRQLCLYITNRAF